ncbi:MAG TPA: outer membrane protein assembly factor BamC [Burkholderiaceae bacterium]|nr:outer membrane protein assembly factor BamC [Burkholderiaceae bacterium]
MHRRQRKAPGSALPSPTAINGLRGMSAANPTEMNNVTASQPTRSNRLALRRSNARRLACSALVIGMAGCSSVDTLMHGDKVDYKASAATATAGLEIPPDLTQLSRESRYRQDDSGAFSAAAYQSSPSNLSTGAAVAPAGDAALRIDRAGNERWLVTTMTPEQLWPVLQEFWRERGFNLTVNQADVGVMETEWNENRARLPQDFIRNTIGKVFDAIYSTGERDKYRTRVERSAGGSDIFISHRGMVEVATGALKDSTVWQPRPADPELEAEMLRRLLLKLGAKEDQAKAMMATTEPQAPRARVVAGQTSVIEVDEGFDRAWRRVGVALDRTGFTVEDRDRIQGIYYVRYADPKPYNKEEPGFFGKLLGFGKDKNDPDKLARYRVQVKGEGERSTVSVLTEKAGTEKGDTPARIATLLVNDLK